MADLWRCAMNLRRKITLWTIAALGVSIVGILGCGWRLQWDTKSGRARKVDVFLWIGRNSTDPQDTRISEWLGKPNGDPNWVTVAGEYGSALSDISPSWCYSGVDIHLQNLEHFVTGRSDRSAYANFLLARLAAGESVCELRQNCRRVEEALALPDRRFSPRSDIVFEELSARWGNPMEAQQGVVSVPPPAPSSAEQSND
jgi:hypothetical protein